MIYIIFFYSVTQLTSLLVWKKALIIPILKIKKPTLFKDYRPVFILCSRSKTLETVVSKQLLAHLELTGRLDPRQSGFKAGHSTQTVHLRLFDDVLAAMDNRLITVLVLFDFSKAFDLINHDILLEKLKQVGCSNDVVAWFRSYLTGRVQAVRLPDGTTSLWPELLTEVPQGSFLGPLLFSIFINSIASVLKYC